MRKGFEEEREGEQEREKIKNSGLQVEIWCNVGGMDGGLTAGRTQRR